MKTSLRIGMSVVLLCLMSGMTPEILGQEKSKSSPSSSKRAKWDQAKAEAMLRSIIEMENAGRFEWDAIAWNTDPDAVLRQSRKTRKPIFLYFSLKGKTGPAAAPC